MQQNDSPDIVAKVRFYSTAEGGRLGPIVATKIFKCIFVLPWGNFDCGLMVEGISPLEPGKSATVPVMFLVPDLLRGRLRVGDKFQLRELKTIADGVIESVLLEGKHREFNALEES